MLTEIHPKLPMRDKTATRDFYLDKLGFREFGNADYEGYLMVWKDRIQIHFFEFKDLDPKENYGQVYIRTEDIDALHRTLTAQQIIAKAPENKPWMQREFSLLDPGQQPAHLRAGHLNRSLRLREIAGSIPPKNLEKIP